MNETITITKSSKKLLARLSERLPTFFELDFLKTIEIKVTSIGNKNLYFTFIDDCGNERQSFCKCL